jgi:hypothetical protein
MHVDQDGRSIVRSGFDWLPDKLLSFLIHLVHPIRTVAVRSFVTNVIQFIWAANHHNPA